jgi:serine/threonine-protein kinase
MQENTLTTPEDAATPAAADTSATPRTDRLELVKELPRGSIGVVHQARSPLTERVTALRQFEVPQWLDDVSELLNRIVAEARAASALDHPNIARLYTCGYKEFNVFVTADFVEGQSLKEMMAARTPDLNEVLAIAKQLCAALDFAHSKGVVHHFLNPSNIKLLPDGTLKVLDFGLLRDKNLLSQTPVKKLENAPYLSPEEVKNKPADRAGNWFTVSTILYELYTTRSPFAGKHLGEVDRAITDSMPHPLNVANGRVPEAISRVVLKGLSKNPAERFQSGQQLVTALEQAMKEPRTAPVKPATGKVPAANSTGQFSANQFGTGSFSASQFNASVAPPKTATSPGTTKSRVPPPPTSARVTVNTSNHWKLVGAVVGGLLVVGALAMFFQRKPSDLPVDSQVAQTRTPVAPVPAPAPAANTPPFTQDEPVATVSEAPQPSGRTRPGKAARNAARVPQVMIQPAPTTAAEGQLAVTSTPAGATVEIEGRAGQSWRTPQTVGPLSPGTYKVTVSRPGFAPETRSIQVSAGGRANLDVRLNAVKGFVNVASTPAGASIFVDGRDTGKATPTELMLDPATHSIAVRKPGYLDANTQINLVAGQAAGYAPNLMVAGRTDNIKVKGGGVGKIFNGGGSSQGMSRIEIKSEPKGAQVVINGLALQKTTPLEIEVEAGNYDIVLQKDGYKPLHENAIVGIDDRIKISKSLVR